MKTCTRCGSLKENEPHYINRLSICKKCYSCDKHKKYISKQELILEERKVYYHKNKVKICKKHKIYNKTVCEQKALRDKEYHLLHRENRIRYTRIWRQRNKSYCTKMKRQYIKLREKTDLNFKLLRVLRTRCYDAIV